MSIPDLPDQTEREKALDIKRSFIVKAPAGSGKTDLLTQRFLKLLSVVKKPEAILAITFTKKATSEMRARIINALQTQDSPYAQAAAKNNAKRGWNLTQNPQRLHIRTIDSLCQHLARHAPITSELNLTLTPTDVADALHQTAAEKTLAHIKENPPWSKALKQLLSHLDNNFDTAQKLLASMLAKRDQWLRHIVTLHEQLREQTDLRNILEESLAAINIEALERCSNTLPHSLEQEILTVAQYAANTLISNQSTSSITALHQIASLPNAHVDDKEVWMGLAELFLTKSGTCRIKVDKNIGFPAEAAHKPIKERMLALLEQLAQDSAKPFIDALSTLRHTPPPYYTSEQWDILHALLEVLPRAAAQLHLTFKSHGKVDHTEITLAALRALGQTESPSDLMLALDQKLEHLLVDEFQDTSATHLELIEKLTTGWLPDEQKTLFVVGDPMQSIYRFRKAEVGLFLRAQHTGVGNIPLESITLSSNFRSTQSIVHWINHTFQHIFPHTENIRQSAVPYSAAIAAQPTDSSQNSVVIHPFLNATSEHMASHLATEVKRIQSQHPHDSIGLLVRNRSHLIDILPALRAEKISYSATEIDKLQARPIIQDLMALTKALLHLGDRIAWLSILRAPHCGLTLSDIWILAHDKNSTIWDNITHAISRGKTLLSPDGQERLTRLHHIIMQASTQRGTQTLRQHVESTWNALNDDSYAAYSDTACDDAAVYFQLLEQLDAGGDILDMSQLEQHIGILFATPQHDDKPIEIMTIHKAKGLEFDTVFLPCLEKTSRASENPLLLWAEQPRAAETTSDLVLAPIHATGAEKDPIYRYLAHTEKCKDRYEQERLLYVAATRAKKNLHLMGNVQQTKDQLDSPKMGSFLAILWPALKEHFQTKPIKLDHQAPSPLKATPTHTNQRITMLLTPPVSQGNRMEFYSFIESTCYVIPAQAGIQSGNSISPLNSRRSLPSNPIGGGNDTDCPLSSRGLTAGSIILIVGTMVHEILARIGTEGLEKWDTARIAQCLPYWKTALAEHNINKEQIEQATTLIKQAIAHTLADPRGRWILESHQHARSEYPITLSNGTTYRIDRTFVDTDGIRWLIDYKTTLSPAEKPEYRTQLATYANCLDSRLRGNDGDVVIHRESIRMGIYFPLQAQWLEITKPVGL